MERLGICSAWEHCVQNHNGEPAQQKRQQTRKIGTATFFQEDAPSTGITIGTRIQLYLIIAILTGGIHFHVEKMATRSGPTNCRYPHLTYDPAVKEMSRDAEASSWEDFVPGFGVLPIFYVDPRVVSLSRRQIAESLIQEPIGTEMGV